jgi:MscS family membrane protein
MDTLRDLWAMAVDVWRNGVFGVDISRGIIVIAILAASVLVRGLFARLVMAQLKAWIRRSKTRLDDQVVAAVEGPIRFVPVIVGVFIATTYLGLEGIVSTIVDNINRSLVIVLVFWALYRLADPLSFLLRKLEEVLTAELIAWAIKAIKFLILLLGAASILELWGIQVGPVIAGLGLLGVAVAFGAQDLFKNLISGVLILAEKRFQNGDWINVEGVVEGTVEHIGFRSTVVRRFDKAPVIVPNAEFAEKAVTNFSNMTHRRIYWTIGVEYRTTVDRLRSIRDGVERYIMETDAFEKPPAVTTNVRIEGFSDSSIDILVLCFTKTTDWVEWMEVKEELAYKVKEIVEGAGSAFAFPSQSLYVESLPADRPEAFVPPDGSANGRASAEDGTV